MLAALGWALRLGGLLASAGLVSMWGLFNSQLLYASRIPFVMARDVWLLWSKRNRPTQSAAGDAPNPAKSGPPEY